MKITPKQTSKPDVVIEMTAREFQVLYDLHFFVGGNPQGPRRVLEEIYELGYSLGFRETSLVERGSEGLFLVDHWPEDQG